MSNISITTVLHYVQKKFGAAESLEHRIKPLGKASHMTRTTCADL